MNIKKNSLLLLCFILGFPNSALAKEEDVAIAILKGVAIMISSAALMKLLDRTLDPALNYFFQKKSSIDPEIIKLDKLEKQKYLLNDLIVKVQLCRENEQKGYQSNDDCNQYFQQVSTIEKIYFNNVSDYFTNTSTHK